MKARFLKQALMKDFSAVLDNGANDEYNSRVLNDIKFLIDKMPMKSTLEIVIHLEEKASRFMNEKETMARMFKRGLL